jgi:hypothetical protein
MLRRSQATHYTGEKLTLAFVMTALRREAARMPRLLTFAAQVKAAALPENALRRADATTRTVLAAAGRTTPCNAMHQSIKWFPVTSLTFSHCHMDSDKH